MTFELGKRQGVGSAALATGVTVSGSLPAFLTGGLSVQVRNDLGFSATLLGILIAVYFGVSAAGSAYMGHSAQRIGLDRSVRLAAAGCAAAMLVAAAAPGYAILVIAMAMAGVANALAQPAANGVLIRDVPESWRGLSFGIKQSAIPIATLLGGLAVPAVALTIGWRWAYVFAAIGALAVAYFAGRKGGQLGAPAGSHAAANGRALEYAPLLVLGASAALAAGAASNLGSFVTASAVDLGTSEAVAGLLLAMGSAVGIAMRLLSGIYSDRSVRDPLTVVLLLLVGGTAGFALMAGGTVALFVPGVALAFGLGWSWPAMFHFAVSRRYGAAAAAATGITQSGVYVGGVVGPIAFGLIAENISYATAWAIGGMSLAAAAAGIALGRWMLARRSGESVAIPVGD
ncbi:MAG: MFS transporter [Dehalococcoidia bacterium]|nr:MFS transporter [Dehalococcoidia bacterium]